MPVYKDGPATPLFKPVPLSGLYNFDRGRIERPDFSDYVKKQGKHAPTGSCVGMGLPLRFGPAGKPNALLLKDEGAELTLARPLTFRYLVFAHTAEAPAQDWNEQGFLSPTRGEGGLGETIAEYVIVYADGEEVRQPIRRRFHIGHLARRWGENCFECVSYRKSRAFDTVSDQMSDGRKEPDTGWGHSQTRVGSADFWPWMTWLYAWENPRPEAEVQAVRFEPKGWPVLVEALTAGNTRTHPLRWESRRKCIVRFPEGVAFQPGHGPLGELKQISLDLGQIISVQKRPIYPNESWAAGYNNQMPAPAADEYLVEYTAHPEARFHLGGGKGKGLPVAEVQSRETGAGDYTLRPVAPSLKHVRLRIVEKGSHKGVAVKLHIHGEAGEYLPPIDRHRIPNPHWFEDYSVDFTGNGIHHCAYVDGETTVRLPLGRVFVEVSKGFEIRPVRTVMEITGDTNEIEIPVERVLPWRERGWVTADTHVHFLSPQSALLEGAGEGVNVVNLLASQWGELMTNVGDFDGRTTHGSREAGGDGEFLVRVGTENRQHILGHISLCGYNGPLIGPMTTGGPDEAAVGDPIEALLTEWAARCRQQGGVVVLPHFPNPRCEFAATIVSGNADAVEMTSWGNLWGGIDPYSLSDWYRFLNCGYFVAAVGGTDKMSANTAVGTVRTYARLEEGEPFTFDAWKQAVRRGNTFVSYGPLMEFSVEGKRPGTWLRFNKSGGTVQAVWKLASVTWPMTRVDLVVNGEIRESREVSAWEDEGAASVKVARSSWIALLVRGRHDGMEERILAHSSPVMVEVEGTPFMAGADALTILEQIEGAIAYFDTLGTRAETERFKQMRLVLTAAHREIHNRLHQAGVYHDHTPVTTHDHPHHA